MTAWHRRLAAGASAGLLVLGACTGSGDGDEGFSDADEFVESEEAVEPEEIAESAEPEDVAESAEFVESDEIAGPAATSEVAEMLDELVENGFCDPADVEDLGPVTAMHFVVGGQLQEPCYLEFDGAPDQRLVDSWTALTVITPTGLIDDISLLAGYECSDCDSLAFVSALDDDATFFLLAVDVIAAAEDPDELLLTMQHELSHVFTQLPGDQLTVGDDDGSCPTYHNGTGCFTADSYMASWIGRFWSDADLDALPPDGEPASEEDAQRRCDLDPAFTGPYAAISPEEDFAESYAAFVFGLELPAEMDAKLAFFADYPEFTEVRDSAVAAGLAGLPNEFEGCG